MQSHGIYSFHSRLSHYNLFLDFSTAGVLQWVLHHCAAERIGLDSLTRLFQRHIHTSTSLHDSSYFGWRLWGDWIHKKMDQHQLQVEPWQLIHFVQYLQLQILTQEVTFLYYWPNWWLIYLSQILGKVLCCLCSLLLNKSAFYAFLPSCVELQDLALR